MKANESRKRALIAESDRNRALLVKDCNLLISGARTCIAHVSVVSGLASVAISIFAKLFKPDRKRQSQAHEPGAWSRTAIDAVSLLSSVWTASHQHSLNKNKNDPD